MQLINTLLYGFGINDADYSVTKTERISGKVTAIWQCPVFQVWINMIRRCYSEKNLKRYPSYKGCSVVDEWKYFSTFKYWMEQQDWEGNHIDKDILFKGNKIYGPDTCVFISPQLNMFLTERHNHRGEYPIGVNWDKNSSKFKAQCSVFGVRKHLGLFTIAQDAHEAWLKCKREVAYKLAEEQTDQRVARALVARYENYITYVGD